MDMNQLLTIESTRQVDYYSSIAENNGVSENSLSNVDHRVQMFVNEVLGIETNVSDINWVEMTDQAKLWFIPEASSGIANLELMNNIPQINKLFEATNLHLKNGDYNIVCLETKNQRKERILDKYPWFINWFYYCLDFILKRVFPKFKYTKKIYLRITKGKNHVISLTEAIGRLISCGFKIIDYRKIGYKTYIVTRKVCDPKYDMNPTSGLMVKLERIGYKGRKVNIYKFRTMYPYSEYVQEYVYNKNGTADGDKIIDDFRITTWGKILRCLWFDELPMFINYFKGDIKLVGVRPLSEHKFNTYPVHLQEKRVKIKPGLLPPYYADLPESVEEFYETEEKYLDAYHEQPFLTDFRYFFMVLYNICLKGERSK